MASPIRPNSIQPARRRALARTAGAASVVLALAGALVACANPTTGPAGPTPSSGPIEVTKDSAIAAMVPSAIAQRGTFTVAVNPGAAPIKFVDTDGKIVGLAPELLELAGKVMGLEAQMQTTTFDALIPGLQAQRFDVIASMGDLKERQETIDFVDYLDAPLAIAAAASFPKDKIELSDLCGLNVGFVRGQAQQGSIQKASDSCTAAGKGAVTATAFQDAPAGMLAVASGQADAFWGDAPPITYNVQTDPSTYKLVYESDPTVYGIGVLKTNPQFTAALQKALQKLEADGVARQVLDKWGQGQYAIDGFPLNTGTGL
ncbi:ABC transporter substrate-binding protein [Microbacterium sp. X-17]|uniref:ABC transporter substrate-binding protein n=1 Tax=Microbacterium sp. X-17 TaxID=3144404 RepID=UPI0031F54B59